MDQEVLAPRHVNIEPTTLCNSRCSMCNRSFDRQQEVRDAGFLSAAIFERLQPFIHTAHAVNLSGFGEPLLHKDFIAMASTVKALGSRLHFFTNALRLGEMEVRELVSMGADQINVSLGSAVPETNLRIRGTLLQAVTDNLMCLRRIKQECGAAKPKVSLHVIAFNSVLDELPQLISYAQAIGASSVWLTHLVAHGEKLRAESPWHDIPHARQRLEEGRRLAQVAGISFHPPALHEYRGDCQLLFTDFTVAWDGRVMSCHREAFVVGDLNTQDAEEIWNGSALRCLRRRYYSEGLAALCANCSVWDHRPAAFLSPRDYSRDLAFVMQSGKTRVPDV